jgi:hypothetical protein
MSATQPAWPLVQGWMASATNQHEVTLTTPGAGAAILGALDGITERSALGALVLHVEALRVDDWLAVLGAGGNGHPGILDFNGAAANVPAIPGALVVGVDVLGGAFAINGGGLPVGEAGEVCCLGPDSLDWLGCGFGHSAFVSWTLNGAIDRFYTDLVGRLAGAHLTTRRGPGRVGLSIPMVEGGRGHQCPPTPGSAAGSLRRASLGDRLGGPGGDEQQPRH